MSVLDLTRGCISKCVVRPPAEKSLYFLDNLPLVAPAARKADGESVDLVSRAVLPSAFKDAATEADALAQLSLHDSGSDNEEDYGIREPPESAHGHDRDAGEDGDHGSDDDVRSDDHDSLSKLSGGEPAAALRRLVPIVEKMRFDSDADKQLALGHLSRFIRHREHLAADAKRRRTSVASAPAPAPAPAPHDFRSDTSRRPPGLTRIAPAIIPLEISKHDGNRQLFYELRSQCGFGSEWPDVMLKLWQSRIAGLQSINQVPSFTEISRSQLVAFETHWRRKLEVNRHHSVLNPPASAARAEALLRPGVVTSASQQAAALPLAALHPPRMQPVHLPGVSHTRDPTPAPILVRNATGGQGGAGKPRTCPCGHPKTGHPKKCPHGRSREVREAYFARTPVDQRKAGW